ncbi:MAG: MFS transporter [Clostridiales bacterium]|nr:MFS transporter [Clostridiales bacterium]
MKNKDIYSTSRFLYIIEETLGYFISIVVSGAYLAKLTTYMGLSDGLTGILSAFVSLGCCFQILTIFIARKRSVKKSLTIIYSLNQLFFALVYFVPFFKVSTMAKVVIFIVLFLSGYALDNVANPTKTNWYMSLIDNDKRGRFTANKEVVSLVSGVLFTMLFSAIIDSLETANNIEGAFVFCGIGIFVLALFHSLTLIFTKEKVVDPIEQEEKKNKSQKGLLKDKTLFKIVLVFVIWYIAQFSTIPFYGTYQIKELGFTMVFVSILSVIGAFSRALFSRPFGKFADKYSFLKLINLCFIIAFAGYVVNVFTTPSNGKVFYTIHSVLFSISMAGVNSSSINLIYDYFDKDKGSMALAVRSTLAGSVGFLTTILVSLLVDKIQSNGNSIFGINVYAQQVVSLIGAIVIGVGILYVNLVVKKIKNIRE